LIDLRTIDAPISRCRCNNRSFALQVVRSSRKINNTVPCEMTWQPRSLSSFVGTIAIRRGLDLPLSNTALSRTRVQSATNTSSPPPWMTNAFRVNGTQPTSHGQLLRTSASAATRARVLQHDTTQYTSMRGMLTSLMPRPNSTNQDFPLLTLRQFLPRTLASCLA
jgi:hypothetical protein